MFRKKRTVFAFAILIAVIFSACSNSGEKGVSSIAVSSKIAEKETVSSYPYEQNDWGIPLTDNKISRPLFISFDKEQNIYYCSSNGTVFRQLYDQSGFSKLFSSKDHIAESVNCVSENVICVGYESKQEKHGYVLLDLKEKTIKNVIDEPEFDGKSILSLNIIGDRVFFLCNPDRYNRYSLYCKTADGAVEIANGVNEYFVLRNKIFYNIGSYIFSINTDGTSRKLICDIATQDLIGFTVASDYIIYSTTECSFITQMYSNVSSSLEVPLKVWTSAVYNDDKIFFCGQRGGIYMFSTKTATAEKLSPYCASDLAIKDGVLYLSPASLSDYPEAEESFVITDHIKTFDIETLLKSNFESEDISSLLSSSEALIESKPLSPENFGK